MGGLRWASASDQRTQTLEDNQEVFSAGPFMQAFTTGKPAVKHDVTLKRHWGEIALTLVEVHIRSALSVPVELGGGPIGTLGVYAADPRGWDQSEVSALQTYAGVVGSLLAAAAKAELKARWPTSSRWRWSLVADRAGHGRPDGTQTPGRSGGLDPPTPSSPVLRPQAHRGGPRSRRR